MAYWLLIHTYKRVVTHRLFVTDDTTRPDLNTLVAYATAHLGYAEREKETLALDGPLIPYHVRILEPYRQEPTLTLDLDPDMLAAHEGGPTNDDARP